MAASSVLRSLLGGLAPLFSSKLYYKLGVGWGFSLLAFIALAFAPVPWVFYKYGEQWRQREKLGVVDKLGGSDGVVDGGDKIEQRGIEV
jgi:hypothetical protein